MLDKEKFGHLWTVLCLKPMDFGRILDTIYLLSLTAVSYLPSCVFSKRIEVIITG